MFHIISKMKGHQLTIFFKSLIGHTKRSWTSCMKFMTLWKTIPGSTSMESARLTKSTSLLARKAPSRRVRASADSKKGRDLPEPGHSGEILRCFDCRRFIFDSLDTVQESDTESLSDITILGSSDKVHTFVRIFPKVVEVPLDILVAA